MKTNNPLHRLIAPLLLAAACASSPLAAQEFVEGRDYERVEPAQNTATGERIEVTPGLRRRPILGGLAMLVRLLKRGVVR